MTPQSAILPKTGSQGLFLVVKLKPGAENAALANAARLPSLLGELGSDDSNAQLVGSCAFGAEFWGRLAQEQPKSLKPLPRLGQGELQAQATGGDLLLHLHSNLVDLNYLAARRFLAPLKQWIAEVEETSGFRYLDSRDLTGFIDGTENPEEAAERAEAALIGKEDPNFAGGSYVLAQRFVHRLERWEKLPDAEQERVIGRTKPDSIELEDDEKPADAHISRVVVEEDGAELEIVRHSMPYGRASGDAGLLFIAYSRDLTTFEKMLSRMFGESGDNLHDRLMEFTEVASGGFFFAPSQETLQELAGR